MIHTCAAVYSSCWYPPVSSSVQDLVVFYPGQTVIAIAVLQPFIEGPSEPHRPKPEGLLSLILGADYETLSEALDCSLQQSLTAAEHCAAGFELFKDMVSSNWHFSSKQLQEAVQAEQIGLDGLRTLLLTSEQQLSDVEHIPSAM